MRVLLFALLWMQSTLSFAAVFSVVPKAGTTLPTQVVPGGIVNAFYTVTNTTGQTRLNNYVKTLPLNVSQVTSGGVYPDTCGITFNLDRDESCTLELAVTGEVNADDSNINHHLMVCLGGCKVCCAGTLFPLNVTLTSNTLTISENPSNATKDVGETATFTVAASGSVTPYRYQWQVNINNTGFVNVGTNSPSYTTPTLTNIDNNSLYRAVVTDAVGGTAISTSATLTINPTPLSVSITPATPTADAGQTMTFTANPSGGSGIYTGYQWYLNGTAITGATNATYTTGTLTTADNNSEYTMTVTDSDSGNATSPAVTLTVNSALSTTNPSNVTVDAGQTATFSITASDGTTPYSYQWQLNAGSGFNNISGATAASYTTGTLETSDSGNKYRVIVTDSATVPTSVTSSAATLTVVQLTVTPSGDGNETISPDTVQDVNYGGTVNFTVTANIGYIASNTVGGTCPTGSWSSTTYTTGAITESCTVTFSGSMPVYITNYMANTVLFCAVSTSGTISGCSTAISSGLDSPAGIAVAPTNNFLYVTNQADNTITYCSINANGIVSNCQTTPSSVNSLLDTPVWIIINPANTYAYIANFSNSTIVYCQINSSNGSLSNCSTTGSGFDGTSGVALNANNTYAYVSNYGNNTVSYCPINSNGSFGTCNTAGNTYEANGVVINANNAYVSDVGDSIYSCPISSTGAFSSTSYNSGFSIPYYIALFTLSGTQYLFVANSGSNDILACPISNGTVPSASSCSTAISGLSAARGIAFFQQNIVTPSGDGNETISPSTPQFVAYNATPSFTVTAYRGYVVNTAVGGTCPAGSWSGSVYTTGAITNACSVTFSTSITVTPSGDGNETISPNTPQAITYYGATQSFTVTANSSYTVNTIVGGTCPQGSWNSSTYTTGAITSSCSVVFSADLSGNYSVLPSGDGNETISPSTPQTVTSGGTQAFTVTANSGYTLNTTVVGGTCPAGSWSGSTYTTGAITASCSVIFSATLPSQYSMIPSGDGNEAIYPNTPQAVAANGTVSFTVIASLGYLVNNTVGGTCPAGSWNGSAYTTGTITENCTVTFSAIMPAYVSISGSNTVLLCAVSTSGTIGTFNNCSTAISSGLDGPNGLAITPTNNFIYIANQSNSTITYCSLNANGIVSNCQATSSSVNSRLSSPTSVTINATGTYAYIGNIGNNNVVYCQINSSNGSLSNCSTAGSGFSSPAQASMNANNTYAYVPNFNSGIISYCPLNSNGTFGTCETAATLYSNLSVAINATNTHAYLSDYAGGQIYSCPITTENTFGSCTLSTGFYEPYHVRLFTLNSTAYLYIGNSGANNVFACPIADDGIVPAASSCTQALSGVSTPKDIAFLQQNIVTPSGDGNETISPSTPQFVAYASTPSFTVTANAGYTVSDTVGGTCPTGSWSGSVYTTGTITNACNVTFSAT